MCSLRGLMDRVAFLSAIKINSLQIVITSCVLGAQDVASTHEGQHTSGLRPFLDIGFIFDSVRKDLHNDNMMPLTRPSKPATMPYRGASR